MRRSILSLILIAALLLSAALVHGEGEPEGRRIRILFTGDMHDCYMPVRSEVDGRLREHGGAARMKTLIDLYSNDATLVVDCGDFSMGTLLGTGYATDAYEMRLMGAMGIDVTTFGDREWDFGAEGVSDMLLAADACGSRIPQLVASSLSYEGTLSEERQLIRDRWEEDLIRDYAIFQVNGLKAAVFGILGPDAAARSSAGGQEWIDYKTAARDMVQRLQAEEKPDLIICLSHSGTDGDGQSGEDMDLIREVSGIDVVISGHSHTAYKAAVTENGAILGSCGECNAYLGMMDLTAGSGGVTLDGYQLIPCDAWVPEDPFVAGLVERFEYGVTRNYLENYGYTFEEPICHSNFDMISLREMYDTHQEYTTGNMIADSYLYEAKKHGITDIDVALVGLGTIRGSVYAGDLTAADAFAICSMGVGSDGSAGHPLVCAYLSGEELKLLTELDASMGPTVPAIKMSYAGLNYRFNTKRIPLDRVTTVGLSRSGGMLELLESDMLYKICCNLYAANMLKTLNGMTGNFLSITPKDGSGNPIEHFEDCILRDEEGREIKEWVALADYWTSFRTGDSGLPEIPLMYSEPQSRKVAYEEGGFARIENPGRMTMIVLGYGIGGLILILLVFALIRRGIRQAAAGKKNRGEMRS